MKKWMSLGTLVTLVSLVAWGCAQQDASQTSYDSPVTAGDDGHGHDHDHDHGHDHGHEHGHDDEPGHDGDHDHGTQTTLTANYCGSCGFAKGTEQCCAAGAETCDKCNLAAGSPLCCKLEGDFSGKELCSKCGEVTGTENCCKADAEKCAKCNLNAGSPLCCVKLAADTGDASEEAQDEGEN